METVSLETLAKTPLKETGLRKKSMGRLLCWELIERTRDAMKLNLPDLSQLTGSEKGSLLIAGGGPSIKDDLKTIRKMHKKAKILACNKTHDWLMARNIKPDYGCLLDPKEWVADYIKKPHKKAIYLISGQCHAKVFQNLSKAKVALWHAGVDYYGEEWPTKILRAEFSDRYWKVVPGPTTVGLRSLLVGYLLGFRDFHLFGFDSSLTDGHAHAYKKPKPYDAREGEVTLQSKRGRETFMTNSHMARQCLDFEQLLDKIVSFVKVKAFDPVNITVHGKGLLPSLAAGYGIHADKELNLKWCGKEAA